MLLIAESGESAPVVAKGPNVCEGRGKAKCGCGRLIHPKEKGKTRLNQHRRKVSTQSFAQQSLKIELRTRGNETRISILLSNGFASMPRKLLHKSAVLPNNMVKATLMKKMPIEVSEHHLVRVSQQRVTLVIELNNVLGGGCSNPYT